MRTLEEVRVELLEHLAFGWTIYDAHWESHVILTFYLVKGTERTGATYHGIEDNLIIPPECRAHTRQTRLFES